VNALRKGLHPELYHGHGRKPPFFEGWYYKLVDAHENRRYAIIPGIFLSDEPGGAHAFVQVLDGVSGRATYHEYRVEEFSAAPDRLLVRIGPSEFTEKSLSLDIDSDELTIRGEVHFEGLTPWPVTLASPGIMGWYGWVPFMECNHGVLSLDHGLRGVLDIDGQTVDWQGGRGYIEKDWGAAFPAAWVWMQTNHFDAPRTSLTASLAIIPWLFRSFRGHIMGLWHNGQLYRFATYTGARVDRFAITDEAVDVSVHDDQHRLELRATRASAGLLRGPSTSDMGRRVPETLSAQVEVRLSEVGKATSVTLFHGTGRCAGLEVAGDLERLLA
jgi:hypothetical protein